MSSETTEPQYTDAENFMSDIGLAIRRTHGRRQVYCYSSYRHSSGNLQDLPMEYRSPDELEKILRHVTDALEREQVFPPGEAITFFETAVKQLKRQDTQLTEKEKAAQHPRPLTREHERLQHHRKHLNAQNPPPDETLNLYLHQQYDGGYAALYGHILTAQAMVEADQYKVIWKTPNAADLVLYSPQANRRKEIHVQANDRQALSELMQRLPSLLSEMNIRPLGTLKPHDQAPAAQPQAEQPESESFTQYVEHYTPAMQHFGKDRGLRLQEPRNVDYTQENAYLLKAQQKSFAEQEATRNDPLKPLAPLPRRTR